MARNADMKGKIASPAAAHLPKGCFDFQYGRSRVSVCAPLKFSALKTNFSANTISSSKLKQSDMLFSFISSLKRCVYIWIASKF